MSAGGVRLARQSAYAPAARHAVVIQLPAGEKPVETVVDIRRETATDLGMCFLTIEPDDRMRLEQAAIIWTRTRLRLAAERRRRRPPRGDRRRCVGHAAAPPARLPGMRPYEGLLTAMVTPFRRDDGAVDEEAAVALGRHLLAHGSHGLVICGTTGEATTMSDAEQGALIALMASRARRLGDDRRRRRAPTTRATPAT